MNKGLQGRLSRLAVLGLAGVGLACGLAYSRLLRMMAVPDAMRYVPEDNGALLATGDFRSLYAAVGAHFPEILQEYGSPAKLIDKLQADIGIDGRCGVLLSTPAIFDKFSRLTWDKGPHFDEKALAKKPFLAVVLLVNRAAFLKWLGGQFGDASKLGMIGGPGSQFELFGYGASLLVTFPDAGTAVISNSRPLLERSLLRQEANLAHARNDDGLYDALRSYLRRPMLSGASLLVAESQDPAMLRRADTVVAFGDVSIDITSHLEFSNRQIAVLENVFRPAPVAEEWAAMLPYRTAAALTLQDDALARYLRFLSQFQDARQGLQEWYGGILWRLQNVSRLRRVTVAVTGYRDGLPDLLVGSWGDAKEIEGVFGQMRADFQKARARALANAQEGYSGEATRGQTDERQYAGRIIRFLTPKLTADDLRLRPEFAGLSGIALTEDRYRLAYATSQGVCWVATEVRDLEQLLDREKPGTSNLEQNPVYRATATQWTGAEKLQFYLNLDQASVLGLLSPESRVETWVKEKLLALKDHPAISMELVCPAINRARLHVKLRKRLTESE